jgi:NTE family protein
MVLRQIPWRRIRRNIDANHLDAVAVSATQVRTGHTVVFVSGRGNHPPPWSRNPFIRVAWTRVGPRHALASAAIPLLFPAVKIAGHLYTDGGLRQNTPMSPAIRLGAERLIVISLRSLTSGLDPMPVPVPDADPFPTPLYMIGKTLNALLLDHTGYDLDRMDRLNAILEAGRTCYGDEFIELINKELMKRRGAPLRTIDALMIRPSEDIGHIASEMVHADRITVDSRITKRTLRSLARQEADDESDAVSYFLFDGSFASALIDLGYRDALAKEDELVALLS